MSYPAATAATNSKTDTPSSLSRIAARQGVFREIKEGETIASPSFISLVLLAEVALQQALEGLAVASLVTNVTEKHSNINTFFKNPTWLDTIFVL